MITKRETSESLHPFNKIVTTTTHKTKFRLTAHEQEAIKYITKRE